ncbi:MAG: hypothetical protein DBX47_01465 [Clostridiales bacterium]|nr:MAG: hypothetical protein DBX47_01465 [Clostridiales bacterium]
MFYFNTFLQYFQVFLFVIFTFTILEITNKKLFINKIACEQIRWNKNTTFTMFVEKELTEEEIAEIKTLIEKKS